jgi:type I restriction enzyme, R subunit
MRRTASCGTREAADIADAKERSQGLSPFIRSLVRLDREAAAEAFGAYLDGSKSPSARSGSSI